MATQERREAEAEGRRKPRGSSGGRRRLEAPRRFSLITSHAC
jgi:hypothetical protein